MDDQTGFLRDALPYVMPFLAFAVLTYLDPVLGISPAWVYGLKTLVVLVLLLAFWPKYRDQIQVHMDLNAVMAGIGVFILWIGLEGAYPKLGPAPGFNPHDMADGGNVFLLMGLRLAGAVLVVPVMEELFWRSFALRFLIDTRFSRVRPGTFTWFSFIFVSIAFGIEHHRWLPGILAGMAYALVWYQRKNLFAPILAHGVTNLLLGVYVIANQAWGYW